MSSISANAQRQSQSVARNVARLLAMRETPSFSAPFASGAMLE
jgi:hypothetical protein